MCLLIIKKGYVLMEVIQEYVVGWRAWHIIHPGYLMSANQQEVWEPGVKNSFRCRSNQEHIKPEPSCQCGFHVVKTLPELVAIVGQYYPIYGATAIWGSVVEQKNGYRAEFAYPINLYYNLSHEEVTPSTIQILERYDVPILPLNNMLREAHNTTLYQLQKERLEYEKQLEEERKERALKEKERKKVERELFKQFKKIKNLTVPCPSRYCNGAMKSMDEETGELWDVTKCNTCGRVE